jgi:hypothetical protein
MARTKSRYHFGWQILHHLDGIDQLFREADIIQINRFLSRTFAERREARDRLRNLSENELDKAVTLIAKYGPLDGLHAKLTVAVLHGFETSELSPAEARLWPQVAVLIGIGNAAVSASALSTEHIPEYAGLIEKFDAFLIHVAGSLGTLIYGLGIVRCRMAAWERQPMEDEGPEKLRRLARAVGQAARVLRGKARAPLTDAGLPEFRRLTIQELKLLFAQLRHFLSTRPRGLTTTDLLTWVSDRLKQSPDGFGNLFLNLVSLKKFLSELDAAGSSFIDLLVVGRPVSAAQFFDNWIAWLRGRDPDKVRQQISRIGSRKIRR